MWPNGHVPSTSAPGQDPAEILPDLVPVAVAVGERLEASFVFSLSGQWLQATLRHLEGRELQASDFRVPWNSLLRTARQELRKVLLDLVSAADEELFRHGVDAATSNHADAVRVREIDAYLNVENLPDRTRRGVPLKPRNFYLEVARIYAEAVEIGERSPKKAVWRWARRNGEPAATTNTAAQWIARCRPNDLGYLTNAPAPGRAGGSLTPLALRSLKRSSATEA